MPVAAQPSADEGGWIGAVLEQGEFWYRSTLLSGNAGLLQCGGLATVAEVWIDGACLLRSRNMFLRQDIVLAAPTSDVRVLHVCFRSTAAALRVRRGGRGRWRPRLTNAPGLRTLRTSFLGRMPGWCPTMPCVGPWRPIRWTEARATAPLTVSSVRIEQTLEAELGRVELEVVLSGDVPADQDVCFLLGEGRANLARSGPRSFCGTLLLSSPKRWWPHTHGEPYLYEASLQVDQVSLPLAPIGFRTVSVVTGDDHQGFGLMVNGVRVFCRGACWTTADLAQMPWSEAALRPWLQAAQRAGMNMLRVGGTMTYEADIFFGLCDELGIMVWHDVMLANFDYPDDEPEFEQTLVAEIEQFLERNAGHPSLAVLCGGSEIMQQAAMLGAPPDFWNQALYRTTIPDIVRRRHPGLVYVENSPSGGALPFCVDTGVAHYYGVGAYLRPLEDARRSGVRFATECLAFANVPDRRTLDRHLPGAVATDPRWKATVPRDVGSSWDFEDVRDHYLTLLFGLDPARLRRSDFERYLELSRATSCLVMERVFAEWRRVGSGCAGGLVWQLQDVSPGSGWGVIDSDGIPKPAWHALRRAFRPRQLVLTDEGLNGLALHVINETADRFHAVVRVTCSRDDGVVVRAAERPISLPGHSAECLRSQELLPTFFDINHAYRFGPPAHDFVTASLWHHPGEGAACLLAYDHYVLDAALSPHDLGLRAAARKVDEVWEVYLTTARFAYCCHFDIPGFDAEDDWFNLSPDLPRTIVLQPRPGSTLPPIGEVSALNLRGSARIANTS